MGSSKCRNCVFLPQCNIADKKHCKMFREPKGITIRERIGDMMDINEFVRLAKEKGASEEMIEEYLDKDAAF